MAEYIERDKLLYEFREIMPDIGVNELADELYNVALNLPAADVAEVKHGKWVKPHWRNSVSCANCSICGAEAYHYDFHGVQKTYRYCPNCGAKMDLED